MKINVINRTSNTIALTVISKIERYFSLTRNKKFKNISQKQLNLILLTSQQIRKINKEIFKRDYITDSISVNHDEKDFLGEVYICPKQIRVNAKAFNENCSKELTRVIIHGILHLAGLDHKNNFQRQVTEKMFRVQEDIVNEMFFV